MNKIIVCYHPCWDSCKDKEKTRHAPIVTQRSELPRVISRGDKPVIEIYWRGGENRFVFEVYIIEQKTGERIWLETIHFGLDEFNITDLRVMRKQIDEYIKKYEELVKEYEELVKEYEELVKGEDRTSDKPTKKHLS